MDNKEFIYLIDKHLCGYGYGTGEIYVLTALKNFFSLLKEKRSYDYEVLERKLGESTTWLLIELLARANWIDYGTSPRFGWLCDDGERVRQFCEGKTSQELYEILTAPTCDEKNDIIDEFRDKDPK